MSRSPMVSCQVILSTLNYLRAEGLPHDLLLDGLAYPRAHCLRASRWIDHATFLEIHQRIADLLDHDGRRFFALGQGIVGRGGISAFTPVTRHLASPFHFYAMLPWFVPRHVMTFVAVEVERRTPGLAILRYRFAPGTEPDALLEEVFRGNLSIMPTWFGQPPAEVQSHREGPGVLRFEVAGRGPTTWTLVGAWAEVRQQVEIHWHRVVDGETVPRPLMEANVRVAQQIEELVYARDELARLNDRLQIEVEERDRAEQARQVMEARMQAAQKLETLGVLAGGIAHDFNNLLVGILASVDLAERAVPPGSAASPHHQRIGTAARRAADLCRLMLTYAGKGRMTLEAVDLARVAQEMSDLVHASRSDRERVALRIGSDVPPVHGDAALLRQVVLNLLTNAIEALRGEDGLVTLELAPVTCPAEALVSRLGAADLPAGGYVRLRVTDTGCGMDAATIDRAFDPFFTTKFTGRGLGLAAVQGAVRSLHGALHVRSVPGEGSCFEVLLPAAAESAARRLTPPALPAVWSGHGTVLLVDDEADVREVGQEILEAAGYRVITARNGREALEVFEARSRRVDCVLLDLTMPQMDGVEACRELRRLAPELRVLLTSGYASPDIDPRVAELEACHFLPKPFTAAGLLEAIQSTLGR